MVPASDNFYAALNAAVFTRPTYCIASLLWVLVVAGYATSGLLHRFTLRRHEVDAHVPAVVASSVVSQTTERWKMGLSVGTRCFNTWTGRALVNR